MTIFKNIRLAISNLQWQESIKRIHDTGDYGMCCGENEAIQRSKEYYFGKLIKYAEKYKTKEY